MVLRNHHYVLSAKKRTNPSSIYSFPVTEESCEFWKHVLSWLRNNDINVGEFKEADLIFGKFDIQDNYTLINHILLLGKYYIYSRKCQNAKPSLKGFIAKLKRIYSIELHIARKRDKLTFHLKKWKKLISVVAN